MPTKHDIKVRVVSQQGTCRAGHKVGDEWVVDTPLTPSGICMAAFEVVLPNLRALRFGAVFPWSSDPDATTVACPDARNPVVFELRRIPKQ